MKTGVKSFLKKFVPLMLAVLMVATCAAPIFAEGETDNPFIYSDLNKTPGGTYGYLSKAEDELVFLLESSGITKSTDIRFFGVEFSIAAGIPTKENMVKMSQELLDKGVNFVCIKDVYACLLYTST